MSTGVISHVRRIEGHTNRHGGLTLTLTETDLTSSDCVCALVIALAEGSAITLERQRPAPIAPVTCPPRIAARQSATNRFTAVSHSRCVPPDAAKRSTSRAAVLIDM